MVLHAPSFGNHFPDTIEKPIGMCLLKDKCVVVASTFEDKVKMFTGCGQLLREVVAAPGHSFRHPSDMVALSEGGFAVRDWSAVRCYDDRGRFLCSMDTSLVQRCYGLAEDGEGRLVTINENRAQEQMRGGTKPGETDLFYWSLATGQLVKRLELVDILEDSRRSKCRFLTWGGGRLLITDLGLDKVYMLDPATKGVTVFGSSGSGPGRWVSGPSCDPRVCSRRLSDPAGLVVDTRGNMLVADSRNHRVCFYSPTGGFVKEVRRGRRRGGR